MSNVRVYELAKEFNKGSKEVLDVLQKANFAVKNNFNIVGDAERKALRKYYSKRAKKRGDIKVKKLLLEKEKCHACGMCAMDCDLIEEEADGSVSLIGPGLIPQQALEKIENIVELCPGEALHITDESISPKGLIQSLKEKMNEPLDFSFPKESEYKWALDDKDEYVKELPIPYIKGEYDYIYKSRSAARSAGEQVFREQVYSQADALAQQLIVSYCQRKLNKVIRYAEVEGNFKYETHKILSHKLKSYVNEMELLCGEKLSLPDGFFEFTTKDTDYIDDMQDRPNKWLAERIHNKLPSASEFYGSIRTDSMDDYVRVSHWFGDDTYETKRMYAYYNMDKVITRFNESLGRCVWRCGKNTSKDGETELNRFCRCITKEWEDKVNLLTDLLKDIDRK